MDPEWLAQKRDEYAGQLKAERGADTDVRAVFIEQTAKLLRGTDRTKYLRFGPYWWAVKRILIAADIGVGNYVEKMWADEYACADDELTLVAAWAFAEDATGRFGVLTREYELDNGMDFVLHDPDMEDPR
jgi:hypothetical protein